MRAISMGFLTPAAFALAAFIPIIIAMYLLKLRRTEQVVSSVYLWRRMVRDLEANAPWQRLRRNLLLILQTLFLAALILALARPFTWAAGTGSQAVILILDNSASMAATDAAPNRLEAAKAQARQLVDGLADEARITVISASDVAQVLVASSQDRRQVHQAVRNIEIGAGNSDLTAALELASAIAARQPETAILILSDGQVQLPERPGIKGQVRYLRVGQSGANQAISTLSLGPAPDDGSMTAFAQVTNYGQAPAQRRLALYADGQLSNVHDLEIDPSGGQAIALDDLPSDIRILQAELLGEDALPLDDQAWAVYQPNQPARVTLVTDGNLFLETSLALLPGLEVVKVRPEDFEEGEEDRRSEGWKDGRMISSPSSLPVFPQRGPAGQSSDLPSFQASNLTILDAYVPITATLPAGNLLFIGPPRGTGYFEVTGQVDQPIPRAVDARDPLLAHVSLNEIGVLDAAQVPLPPWARPVIVGDLSTSTGPTSAGDTTPLLFAGEVDGRRVAVLTFDLHRSDLPLQVAFPLLLANLKNWLAPGASGLLPAQVDPGAAVTLSLPPGVESATVTRPDGSSARLMPEAGQVIFADTAQLGVYEVVWRSPELVEGPGAEPVDGGDAVQARFAVNLFSPQESNVGPAETLPVLGIEDTEGEDAQQARREWWRVLGFAALALLMTEWLIYQRASLVWLRGKWRKLSATHLSEDPDSRKV